MGLQVSAPPFERKIVPEHTDAWVKARLGHLTASRMSDVMGASKSTGKPLKARRDYAMELVSERMTGIACNGFVSKAMEWGIAMEPQAKLAYMDATGNHIEPCGFIRHPTLEWCGATPDGFLEEGNLEFKCPTSQTHLTWILDDIVPKEYQPQMLLQILVTERPWCEFVSYDPRMPPRQRLFIKRFVPTADQLRHAEDHAKSFLIMVASLVDMASK